MTNSPGGDLPPLGRRPEFWLSPSAYPAQHTLALMIRGELLDEETVARARAAGLEIALRDFPEDVAAAAGDAFSRRIGFTPPDDPSVEPWPPMQPATKL